MRVTCPERAKSSKLPHTHTLPYASLPLSTYLFLRSILYKKLGKFTCSVFLSSVSHLSKSSNLIRGETPIYHLSVRSTGGLGLDWYLKQEQSQGTKSFNLQDLTPQLQVLVSELNYWIATQTVFGERAGIRKKKIPEYAH